MPPKKIADTRAAASVAQQLRRPERHADFVERDDVRLQRSDPGADQRAPVGLMVLLQVERRDSELHRALSVASRDPVMLLYDPIVSKRCLPVWGAAVLLLVLYLAPVLVSFCLPDPRGGVPWHQARRDATGLSPDPAVMQEAVIQVFAAPAVAWRGLFSV
jgi:hypothetical protein